MHARRGLTTDKIIARNKIFASDKIIAKTLSKAQNYCYEHNTLLMAHLAGKCVLNKIIAMNIMQAQLKMQGNRQNC